jgi:hypothetical protein
MVYHTQKMETDPVFETSCFLVPRIPDDGKKSKNPVILRPFCVLRTGRGNASTPINLAPMPFCTPQIPHLFTWDGTRSAAVEIRAHRPTKFKV